MLRTLRKLLVLGVCLSSCRVVWSEDPVYFADPTLKAVVEDQLYVWDPTPTDMLWLTALGYFEQDEVITSLTGLEYATNLQELRLRFNHISDISALSGLTNLRVVDLSRNQISDLSPLSGLGRLTYLNIHGNQISDLSPLAGLTGLQTLILRFNQISDISPLSGLTNLSELDLGCNQIRDICPLAPLTQLLSLGLWDNQISDLSALTSLTRLVVLDIDINRLSDLSPLAGMSILYELDLANNLISDVGPLCELTSLTYLDLEGNPLTGQAYDVQIPQIIANNPTIYIRYGQPAQRTLSVASTAGGSVVVPGEGDFNYAQDGVQVRLEAQADPNFVFAGWSGDVTSTQNPTFVTLDRNLRVRASFLSVLEVIYVDAVAADPNEDGSQAHPFDAIQEAINVAAEGVAIHVCPGTYCENIDFLGKTLSVLGIDPDHFVVKGPRSVIAAAASGPVVRFDNGEGPESLLAGFVITQGRGNPAGAILCDGASPSVVNCLIVGNRATAPDAAAIYCRNSQAVLSNCTIADNDTGSEAAALVVVDSNVTVVGSILWGNTSQAVLSLGSSEPIINCCNLQSGYREEGNIEADPLFARRGSWVNTGDPNETVDPEDPRAVWAAGDYHVSSWAGRWSSVHQRWVYDKQTSPCIDAGLPGLAFYWEPKPNGWRINMGVYGGTVEASKSLFWFHN